MVGIELADLNQFFDLGDADLAASGDHRVKISRRFAVNEVAGFVALPCLHDRQLGRDTRLEDVIGVAEIFRLLALSQFGGETSPRVKSRNSRAACA